MIGPKRIWLKRSFKLAFFLLFLTVSSYTLLQVYGYELSMREGGIDVVRTSLVDIRTNVDDLPGKVTVKINGKVKAVELPITLSLVPGRYTVQVEKESYFIWEKVIEVQPYYVTVLDTIFLVSRLASEKVTQFMEADLGDFYLSNDSSHLVFLSPDRRKITWASFDGTESVDLILPEYVYCERFIWDGELGVCVDQSGFRAYQLSFLAEQTADQFQLLEQPPVPEQAAVFLKDGREIWHKKGVEEFLLTRFSFDLDSVNALDAPGALLISAGSQMMLCDHEADNCVDLGRHTANTPLRYVPQSDEFLFIRDGYLYSMQFAASI